jgi:Flp pilus assembly protein TadD
VTADHRKPIGRILLEQRAVSAEQLQAALRSAQPGDDEPLASRLTREGVIREEQALKALSRQSGFPGIDLNRVCLRLSVLDALDRETAERHLVMPLLASGERLFVAMVEPGDAALTAELEARTGRRIFPYIALRTTLRRAVPEAYALRSAGRRHYVGPSCTIEKAREIGASVMPPPLPSDADVAPYPTPAPRGRSSPSSPIPSPPPDDGESLGPLVERDLHPGGRHGPPDAPARSALAVVVDEEMEAAARSAGEEAGVDFADPILGASSARPPESDAGAAPPHDAEPDAAEPATDRSARAAAATAPTGVDVTDLLRRGAEAYRAGRVHDAVEHLRMAAAADPGSFAARHQLGLLYAKLSQPYAAIQELESALQIQGDSFATVKNLAVLYQSVGFRARAVEMWKRCLERAPDEATAATIRRHLAALE